MSADRPTAIVADDEPLLRRGLRRLLADAWPQLEVVAQARNGREAVEKFEALRPDVVFLDVHMPGISGVEAARLIGRRAQLVFVTAYDQYAVDAFEHGAIDYLLKPVSRERLRLVYGNAATLAIVANFPNGVAATITGPVVAPGVQEPGHG